MLLVHGTYHWLPRRTAFRNDFYMACAAPRRADQISTLNVLHIFWVPVAPLGRWKRWRCTGCGNPPNHNVKTRRIFKIAGVIVLVFFTVVVWTSPGMADEPAVWAVRVIAPLGAVASVIHIATSSPDEPGYRARRLAVVPADDEICPFCGTTLFNAPPVCFCPACDVRRY
jgi:hypothetical protein